MGLKEVVSHWGGALFSLKPSDPLKAHNDADKWLSLPHPSLQSTKGFMWRLLEMWEGFTPEAVFGLLGLSPAIWRTLKMM